MLLWFHACTELTARTLHTLAVCCTSHHNSNPSPESWVSTIGFYCRCSYVTHTLWNFKSLCNWRVVFVKQSKSHLLFCVCMTLSLSNWKCHLFCAYSCFKKENSDEENCAFGKMKVSPFVSHTPSLLWVSAKHGWITLYYRVHFSLLTCT